MKLSIIMPVYNGAERLPRMLDCLAAQTCRNFELIAVDDGSTDLSCEVLTAYADRINLRLIRKQNGGASSAYNQGLGEADGDYVYMLDQDDLLHPRAVECMLLTMDKGNADYMIFDYRDVSELFMNEIHREFSSKMSVPDYEVLSGNRLRWFIAQQRNPGIWQFCFRRELVKTMHFVEGITLEDNLFVFPLLSRPELKAIYLPVTLYAYLQQPQSVMHTSKLEWRLKSFEIIFRGLSRILSAEDYRFLMSRHFVPELKSMWRASSFSGKHHFARFMHGMFAEGLAYRRDFPLRWNLKFNLRGVC